MGIRSFVVQFVSVLFLGLCVSMGTGHAWEFSMKGIITLEHELYSQLGSKGFFGRYDLDNSSGASGANLAARNGWLGNETASGTEIIARLGDEHLRTGRLIVYTSADSVFQIAAHEGVVPPEELYRVCGTARRLLDGVIAGVRDGGNKSGIPTPYGNVIYDQSYLGKCLVFVTAVGIMPARVDDKPSDKKTTNPGDLIFMCGGRVGKDGIHGVTAASEEYSEHTPAGHVQIGDPYTQKKMHDFLIETRDEDLIEFITDNGGGGLSSSPIV